VILDLLCYFWVQISLPCKIQGTAYRFFVSSLVRFWTLKGFRRWLMISFISINYFNFTWSVHQPMHTLKMFILKLLKMLRHVSIIRSSSGSCLFLAKITLLKTFTAWFSYNSLVMWLHIVLCRSSAVRSAPDCVCRVLCCCRSIFKSFNTNNLSVYIGWCTDQVTLRSARCKDKD